MKVFGVVQDALVEGGLIFHSDTPHGVTFDSAALQIRLRDAGSITQVSDCESPSFKFYSEWPSDESVSGSVQNANIIKAAKLQLEHVAYI